MTGYLSTGFDEYTSSAWKCSFCLCGRLVSLTKHDLIKSQFLWKNSCRIKKKVNYRTSRRKLILRVVVATNFMLTSQSDLQFLELIYVRSPAPHCNLRARRLSRTNITTFMNGNRIKLNDVATDTIRRVTNVMPMCNDSSIASPSDSVHTLLTLMGNQYHPLPIRHARPTD